MKEKISRSEKDIFVELKLIFFENLFEL